MFKVILFPEYSQFCDLLPRIWNLETWKRGSRAETLRRRKKHVNRYISSTCTFANSTEYGILEPKKKVFESYQINITFPLSSLPYSQWCPSFFSIVIQQDVWLLHTSVSKPKHVCEETTPLIGFSINPPHNLFLVSMICPVYFIQFSI